MAEAQANLEQIRYWNEQGGPRWVQRQQQLDAQINPLGLVAMQRAGVTPGEQVLDVGCGCGQTALELAQRVGASGSVVGIDISQPLLTRARMDLPCSTRKTTSRAWLRSRFCAPLPNRQGRPERYAGSQSDVG